MVEMAVGSGGNLQGVRGQGFKVHLIRSGGEEWRGEERGHQNGRWLKIMACPLPPETHTHAL